MKKPEHSDALKALWPKGVPITNATSLLKENTLKPFKTTIKPTKKPVISSKGKLVAFRKNLH
ncbi:MAG: hypothetical protein CVT92_17100 [Bacteroidetes bacterium HGW-Bacteroidetes-1]|jgi:hypothetical protein|nr:MAG: hypothetical protein CVT92_17100 [Bacteroidetes bacterium HGW-Bacteroidetes-1]